MRKSSGYLIAISFIIGALTVIGWLLDIEFLKRPFAQTIIMKPVTGLSMVMAGISFYLICKSAAFNGRLLIGRFFAFGVLSIGLSNLLALAGINLDLDKLLFGAQFISGNESTTNDIPTIINSAIGFLITGTALLLSGLKGKWPGIVINFLALFGFIIGTFSCIGFIYHVPEFYGILPRMSVAPTTAVCFVTFAIGIMFQNSEAGFMSVISSPNIGGQVARPVIPIGILVPLIFGYIRVYLAGKILFSIELSTAVLMTAIVVVFLAVLWVLAGILNLADEQRRKAERQLEQQAQLFDLMPDGIIYGDLNNRVISLNKGAEMMFETTPASAIGKNIDELLTVTVIGRDRETSRRELDEHGFVRHEAELTNRSGKKITVLATIKKIEDLNNSMPGWVCVYTDISPLRLNDELRAANSYLEQLAYISSHDIKSPILTLSGLVDMMYSSKNLRAEDFQILEMEKNVIHQLQLTNKGLNEILQLRKNLATGGIREAEMLPLKAIVTNITDILQNEFELSGSKLEMNIGEVSEIKFPFVYMQSVFYNLISNSLKYRDPDRPLIIKFTGGQAGLSTLKFIIEDNGLGFNLEQSRSKVFGIFKRFHSHVEGTGIGLHIVKSTIDALGGSVEVESEQGKGTRFEIILKIPGSS